MPHIFANLYYAAEGGPPAVFHASAGAEGENRVEGRLLPRVVRIADGRERIGSFALDTSGFVLVRHKTAVTDFYDEAQLNEIYEPEARVLAQTLTGASRVVVFDHTIRTDSSALRNSRKIRDAVPLVHNDYTDRSARQRLRDLFPASEADALLAGRFAILNIWRSIGGVVETTPLALCDARSIAEGDLLPMERRASNRIGEMQQAKFKAEHSWYFFPKMDRHEALVFKTFDSSMDGRARRSLHSAFESPVAPNDAPPRESLETRMFALFSRA